MFLNPNYPPVMKNQKPLLLLIFALFFACEESPENGDGDKGFKYPELEFDPNQAIIVFEEKPDDSMRQKFLMENFPNILWNSVKVKKCSACDTYMELWEAEGIGTDIHGRPVPAGSGTSSRIVGEDSSAMAFLNIKSSLPTPGPKEMELMDTTFYKLPPQPVRLNNKVVIAVIDTGIDLDETFGDRTQLWNNPFLNQGSTNESCHFRGENGWNFIADNGNIQDDHVHEGKKIYHGTKVSQLIVSQINSTSKNNIEIMALKTHDENGSGDLFSNICAIHYAMDHRAHIINASWGFYDDKLSHEDSYLVKLITGKIADKGILFVTAAGNEIPGISPDPTNRNPRDLEQVNFIPAVFSERENNIVVATTIFENEVSPSQNFSSKYVDYGVKADNNEFEFKPRPGAQDRSKISGSSYATAILSGKIGASVPVSAIQSGISKDEIINIISPRVSLQLDSERKIHKGYFIHSNIE